MNLCFVIGKIVSNIDFQFILQSKNISIALFKIQLYNNSIVAVKAYNEIAYYCYKKLEKNSIICIQGELNSKLEIIINNIEIIGQDNK